MDKPENTQEDLSSMECCCTKRKHREEEEFRNLMNRLNRVEGQIRGIKGMLERDAYCVDILTQVSAVQAALNSFNKVLLGNHIKTCVVDSIREGNDEVIDELVNTIQKVMK
ncbi:metal-sensing transcriptional repressor [Anaerosporobacter faecicola]|uniref:metal-sensing transcriptional repressor n=1 Tax=Anaerosporobacter faecicola TaxID=2718714 RepID=UPI001A9B13A6|nr:metal-sensing transcriptional repressor [Anaerosporobacter faecicola]